MAPPVVLVPPQSFSSPEVGGGGDGEETGEGHHAGHRWWSQWRRDDPNSPRGCGDLWQRGPAGGKFVRLLHRPGEQDGEAKKTKNKKKTCLFKYFVTSSAGVKRVFGFTALLWQKRLYLVVNIQWFQMGGPQGKRLLMQIQQSSGSGRAAFCQRGGRSRWESLSKLHSVSFKSDTWKRFGLRVLKKKNVQEENGHGQAINCVNTLPDSN